MKLRITLSAILVLALGLPVIATIDDRTPTFTDVPADYETGDYLQRKNKGNRVLNAVEKVTDLGWFEELS